MEGVSNPGEGIVSSEPIKERVGFPFFLTFLLSFLFLAFGVVSTTLAYLYIPEAAKMVGIVNDLDESMVGDEQMVEEEEKADDLNWVEYKDNRLGISFMIPDGFIIDTEDREKDGNNPASYDLLISYALKDNKGNYPAIKSTLVEISDRRVLYSYSEDVSPLEDGDPKSFTVNGKEYEVEKSVVGDGGGGGWSSMESYAIAINSTLHARLFYNSSGFDPALCYEEDLECMKMPAREYITSKEHLDIGKKIIESIKYIK